MTESEKHAAIVALLRAVSAADFERERALQAARTEHARAYEEARAEYERRIADD